RQAFRESAGESDGSTMAYSASSGKSRLRIAASIFKPLKRWNGYSLSWRHTWISRSCRFALFPFDVLLMMGANNFQRRANGPENLRQSTGERYKEVYVFLR